MASSKTLSINPCSFVILNLLCHSQVPLSFPSPFVIPAKAGIQNVKQKLDSLLRGNDKGDKNLK